MNTHESEAFLKEALISRRRVARPWTFWTEVDGGEVGLYFTRAGLIELSRHFYAGYSQSAIRCVLHGRFFCIAHWPARSRRALLVAARKFVSQLESLYEQESWMKANGDFMRGKKRSAGTDSIERLRAALGLPVKKGLFF